MARSTLFKSSLLIASLRFRNLPVDNADGFHVPTAALLSKFQSTKMYLDLLLSEGYGFKIVWYDFHAAYPSV